MAKVKDLLVNGSSRFIGKIYASDQFISQVANGTAPFVVSSSTLVVNLNADMTDGLHVHTGRNNEVNKIVRTDGYGYIQTGYINTDVGTQNFAISRIFYEYNNDGYIRKMSPSSFFSVLENSGNDISITVAGQNRKLTVGYASNSDKLDGCHASDLTKFYLSPMEGSAPASSAKSWFENTMPSGAGAIVYNVPGSEKTIIAGKSTGAHGHMLQLNYEDNYLRILRYCSGKWITSDWEKISAGYADSAGNSDTIDGYHYNNLPYVPKLAWHSENSGESVNDLVCGTSFYYTTHGAPTNGVVASFTGTHNSYQLQIQGNYFGKEFWYRSKNGDNGTWNAWTQVIDTNNIGSQSVTYADSAGDADKLDGYHANDFATAGHTHYIGTTAVQTYSNYQSLTGINKFLFQDDGSLAIYTTDGGQECGDEHVNIQTCFDNKDPQTHEYVNDYSYRCNLVLQPRGGQVVIGKNMNGVGNTTEYKLRVGGSIQIEGDIYTTTGFKKNGSDDSYVLLGGGGHKLISDFATSGHTHSLGNKSASDLSSTYPSGISVGGIYDNGYPFTYGCTITASGNGGYFQIAGQWNSNVTGDSNYDFPTEMYIRGRRDSYDVWTTWTRVLTDRNYTNVLDNRYYTETEADNRFVNVTGDSMSGRLNIGVESSENANPLCLYHSNVRGSEVKGKSVGIRLGHEANSYYARIAAIFESQNPDYLRPGLAFYTMDSTYQENTESERMRISAAGNVGIGTTSPGYKLQIAGDSYTTGWSRADSGFYVEGTGVHFTHQGSLGEIDMTSNNEFLWGSSSDTLYFNYRTVSRGTTVNNYIWNAGSSTSWASHNMGNIWLNGSGVYLRLGPQNSSHAHYETNASVSHWFNKRVDVNGDIWRYGTNYGITSDGYFHAKAVYANRDGSTTGGGVSLYSNSDPMNYGIAFRGTGTYGIHGFVTSANDWATYLTMSDDLTRGWIFRRGSTNVASIAGSGNMAIGQHLKFSNEAHISTNRSTDYHYGYTFNLGDNTKSIGMYSGPAGEAGGVVISPDGCLIYNSSDCGYNLQVRDKDLGSDLTNIATLTFAIEQGYYAWSRGGFKKNGSDDSYVLLGGGGHKAESALSVNYANSAGTTNSLGSGALKYMCSLYATGTYNAYKITTDWHKSSNIMPTINIRGYAYGSERTIDCDIVMYHYENSSCNYSLTNKGSYPIRVWQAIENDVQVFYINPGEYFGMFNVFVYGGIGTDAFSNWSMTTVDDVSGTEIGSVPIATSITGNADTVDNLHASNFVKFYLSPMDSGAPASSAKSWFTDTMPSSSGAIVYNVPGSEKTIIAGKSTGAHGHMLQLNYEDNYLRILRYCAGKWITSDWEKVSAGYADAAGNAATATNADKLDGVHYQNILERQSSGYSESGTATGWFRITETLTTDGAGITFLLAIQRAYYYTNNESYLFSISISYYGGISITQLSGYANTRLITKIRVDWSPSQIAYVDLHIDSSTTTNIYYWYTVGCAKSYTAWTANPTLVGHAYEFTTVNGCKSDRGFTGDLSGNATTVGGITGALIPGSDVSTGYWGSLGYGSYGKLSIGTNYGGIAWHAQDYCADLMFGCSIDTHGFISVGYASPIVSFAGSNNSNASNDNPNWYFKLKGTTGTTYDLNCAPTATKLQNSRTIWGQSFDGTGNVSGALSEVTDITASGHTKVNSLKTQYICIECDNSGNTAGRSSEINNYAGPLYIQHNTSNNCFICSGGGNVGIGTTSPSYKLHVVGDIYTTTGFKKEGSSDSYVLLGGGGHKALSDFDIPASTTSSGITSLATGSYSSIHISTRSGGTMSFSSIPASGKECHIVIYNSGSSNITITLPSGYRRNIDSITIASGAFGEVNVLNAAGTIYVRAV